MKKILVLLLLLTPLAANAELFDFFLKAALIIASPLTGFVFYAALAITAYGEYKSEELRRQAESQRNAAREKYNAGLDDRTITNVSTEAAHVYIYGESRVGSCVVAMIPSGSKDQYQHIIAIHAAHECESFQELYLGKKALGTLDADGFAINSPDYSKTIHAVEDFYTTTHTIDSNFIAGTVHVYQVESYLNEGTAIFEITLDLTDNIVTVPSPPQYNSYRVMYDYKTSTVRVKKHLGTPGEAADATLIAECPTKWTSLSKLSGYCYTYWRLDLNQQEFQGGLVGIEALLRGKKLYDPRTTTIYWSQNPALALRDYLLGPCCNVPTVDVPDADVITAANICDESVTPVWWPSSFMYSVIPVPKRYYINGTVTSDQDQEHVIEQMVQSMAGGIESSTWSMWAGKYVAPTLALVQSDIVGAIAISPGPSQSDVCNGITARFIGPENDYAPTDMPPYVNAVYLYADGREMFMSREYPFTYDSWHCHNLARITVEDMRNGFTVKATFSLKAWDTKVGQRVTLTSSVFGFSAKIFRIVARSYSPTGFPELTLKEDAASIWDEADAIQVDATLNSNLPNPFVLNPPSSLTLTSGDNELLIQSDGTIVSRIKAVWGAPTSIYARIARLQFKKVVDSVWIDGPQVDASACLAYLSPVQDLATYDTRIQYLNPQVQTESTWTYGGTHTVIGKSAPPAAFDVFTVLAQPDGTRQYNFGYTTTTKPTDWMGAEIRYVSGSTGSPDWATMTPLQDTDTYYTSSPVELNIPLAGTYTFACKSIDTTGNLSTYKVWSITLPDRRLGDIYDEFFERSEGWTGAKTGCHVQEGNLEANDSITWATSSGTFSGYARWNTTPSSPIYYETPARDFGTIVAGNINSTIDADGTVVQELATSTDGSSWTGWSTAAAPFSTRYLKLRLTVTATGPAPIPLIRQFDYQINAKMETEYINDVVISGLTGSYRIGTGDIRIPLASTYTFIKRTAITIQDSTAGTWTATRIDQTLTYGPRWQFRLNGTLADPAYVDFFIEGFRS